MTRALIRHAPDAACLALMALIAVGTGHLFLNTALAMPDLLDQAEAARGM